MQGNRLACNAALRRLLLLSLRRLLCQLSLLSLPSLLSLRRRLSRLCLRLLLSLLSLLSLHLSLHSWRCRGAGWRASTCLLRLPLLLLLPGFPLVLFLHLNSRKSHSVRHRRPAVCR